MHVGSFDFDPRERPFFVARTVSNSGSLLRVSGRRAKRERQASIEPIVARARVTPWLFRLTRLSDASESLDDRARFCDPGIAGLLWFASFWPNILLAAAVEVGSSAAGVSKDTARHLSVGWLLVPIGVSVVCFIRALAHRREDYVRWPDEALGMLLGFGAGYIW